MWGVGYWVWGMGHWVWGVYDMGIGCRVWGVGVTEVCGAKSSATS